MKPSRSGHLPINGLQLYYEAHGELGAFEAVPLLLIPGSFQSTDSMKEWVAAFVATRPVIVFDQQGHGRTADTPRTMSYEKFGDDAAALLHALEVGRADVMGYSQGGGVALQLALRHPRLVSKLVTFFRHLPPGRLVPVRLTRARGSLRRPLRPATSHVSIFAVVQVLEPMITAFLDDMPPANPSLW